ncbi:hypothetical protein [Variovorax gossypii]
MRAHQGPTASQQLTQLPVAFDAGDEEVDVHRLAILAVAKLALQTVVTGLNDPSSGAVLGDRVYFIESKYALLTRRKDSDGPVPTGVPFDIQSHALPRD